MTTRLEQLRDRARKLGVRIDAERNDSGWGYWLINNDTGEGVWMDDNFCTSHDEISSKLDALESGDGPATALFAF